MLCPLCLPGNIRFFRGDSLNVRVGRQIRTFQSGCRLLERLWRYLRFGTGNAFVLAGKALFFVVLRISRGEDKICSAGVLRSGILVGRVGCFLYIPVVTGRFFIICRTRHFGRQNEELVCFGLCSEMLCSGGKAPGEKKHPEAKVQKRVEGKGRKKERGVGKTEIRKTGGRGKGRKKGGRKKRMRGNSERRGKKENSREGKKGRNGRKKENGKRNGMKQNRKYLTKNKILHMVATYLTIINFAYEFNFISAVVREYV